MKKIEKNILHIIIFLLDFKKIIEINTPIIVVASAILSPEKYITEKIRVKIMITEESIKILFFNLFLNNIIKKILIK